MAKMDRFNLRSNCNISLNQAVRCQPGGRWGFNPRFSIWTFLISMSQQRIVEQFKKSSIWVEHFGFGHREWVVRILSRDKSKNWSLTFGLFTADTDKGNWEKVLNWTAIVEPAITKVITQKNFELIRVGLKYRLHFSKIWAEQVLFLV